MPTTPFITATSVKTRLSLPSINPWFILNELLIEKSEEIRPLIKVCFNKYLDAYNLDAKKKPKGMIYYQCLLSVSNRSSKAFYSVPAKPDMIFLSLILDLLYEQAEYVIKHKFAEVTISHSESCKKIINTITHCRTHDNIPDEAKRTIYLLVDQEFLDKYVTEEFKNGIQYHLQHRTIFQSSPE